MTDALHCYRCGTSLARLTLPLSRLDECPSCRVHLHVCRMCVHYAPSKPKQCTEDDALEVRDKRSANFCDYFRPNPRAFAGDEMTAENQARAQLEALFGASSEKSEAGAESVGRAGKPTSSEPSGEPSGEPSREPSPEELARRQAEDLFKK
jgi:hypothetical protein